MSRPRKGEIRHRPLTDAEQAMVRDNARLVTYAVRRYLRRGGRPAGPDVDADDLLSVAALALCRAARLFDPSRGVRFGTYAFRAIWLSIDLACNPGAERVCPPLPCVSLDTLLGETTCRLGEVFVSREPGPEAHALSRERLHEYEAAIGALNPTLRGAMASILMDETSREYAERVGVSWSAANNRRIRARETLREMVQP